MEQYSIINKKKKSSIPKFGFLPYMYVIYLYVYGSRQFSENHLPVARKKMLVTARCLVKNYRPFTFQSPSK